VSDLGSCGHVFTGSWVCWGVDYCCDVVSSLLGIWGESGGEFVDVVDFVFVFCWYCCLAGITGCAVVLTGRMLFYRQSEVSGPSAAPIVFFCRC